MVAIIRETAAVLLTPLPPLTKAKGKFAMATSDSTTPTKRCTKCGRDFPATTEYFHRSKRGKHGIRAYCKECANSIALKRHYDKHEEILARKRAYVQSHKEDEKRRKQAWMDKNRDKALAQKRQRWADNREAIAVIRRSKYRENREKNLEAKRRYYETHRHELLEKSKEYYRLHRDERRKCIAQYQQQHKARKRATDLEWKRKNPEKARANARTGELRRRALEANLPSQWSNFDWERCLNYWQHRCCVCGRPQGLWHVLAREHWIPLSDPRPDNPGTVPWNILPMCHTSQNGATDVPGCNNSKWKKDPVEWLVEKLGKRKAAQKLAEIEVYFEWVKITLKQEGDNND
jgi:hypothetical protein